MTRDQTTPTASVTLAPLFDAYRTRLERRGRKPQTVVNFTRAAVPFQVWLEGRGLEPEAITEDDLYAYFAASPYAQGTRRMHAVQIRAAYSYAHRKGWDGLAADPFADFEPPRAPDPEPRAIPSSDLRRMRGDCPTWKHELLWGLLVFTGLRRDEVRRLTWDADAENRVDLAEGTITVVGKGGKRRTVPIHPVLESLLRAAPDSRMRTDERVGAVLWTSTRGSVQEAGGIYAAGQSFEKLKRPFAPQHGFHAFRRTVASSLARNAVDGDTIDKIMGWAAAGIRAKYYVQKTPDDLRNAINRLYLDDAVA